MLNIGDIVKINIDYVDVNIKHRYYFPKNEEYKVIGIVPTTRDFYRIEGLNIKNIYEISGCNLTKIEEDSMFTVGDIESKSLNSTMEELYEMIIKENCSEDLKNKFWDLHKVLTIKEKEAKIRLEEINKLLWE